ncbi:MAG: endo-beta-N-acetylglucosaminidase [Bacteroidales bacterium]
MKNNKLFWLSTLLIGGSGSLLAQTTPQHPHYIKSASTTPFYTAYRSWTSGTPLYNDDAQAASDEEFFISRVKPRQRFSNANTQVDPQQNSERKMLWWCPVGTTDGGDWNAQPSYFFDSEVFSMWSYVDIYGNWTAPFVRMPAAFMDVCHKNGVATSVLASVPWAERLNENTGHGANFKAMYDGGTDKLLQFLRHYGIDGIGFNSEFYSGTLTQPLKEMLTGAFEKKDEANWPTFHNCWYSLMSNSGGVQDYSVLNDGCKEWFDWQGKTTSNAYFLNYNWGGSQLNTSQTTARNLGRNSFDVYAGMDFQGRSAANWVDLKKYDISVGIWGAHNMNMIFEGRGALGSSATQRQKTYQLTSENTFTGSSFNPVNTPAISNILRHTPTATDFHGFSSFITARSAMWTNDLAKEPMVTYFNLGNGQKFNVEGQTTFDKEWYNLGVQDYLPTWRWWLTTNFMGRQEDDVMARTSGLQPEFTWDDAWFGGSCLQISGSTSEQYLHLFKTKYPVLTGDELTIRYKVVSGSGTMAWACSVEDAEDTEVPGKIADMTADEEQWLEAKIKVGTGRNDLRIAGKTLAMMALKFTQTTSDFKVYIGEVSLMRSATPTPEAPIYRTSEMLGSNYKGVDMKIFFKMVENYPAPNADPVYNADVNTWYYKVYTQQEGCEPVMCNATTSWAAYVVGAPYNNEVGGKMRIGVSAVSVDGNSESPITWGEYQTVAEPTVSSEIAIDKPIIKANEEFTIAYVDPNYPAAREWKIQDVRTDEFVKTVADATGITTSLENEGIYNLFITDNAGEIIRNYGMIQISSDEVGAMPSIESLKANGSLDPIEVGIDEEVTLSYIGRDADGFVSRGLNLNERAFGVDGKQLGFSTFSPFSIAFWFKAEQFIHGSAGTQLLNIRSPKDKWPASDWGYVWNDLTPENEFSFSLRRTGNEGTQFSLRDFKFLPNQWYHLVYVFENQGGGRVVKIYVNGKLVFTSQVITDVYSWRADNFIMFGGGAFNRSGVNGLLDEFQIYNRAINDDEALASMKHLDVLPEGLVGYWDFETEAMEDGKIYSTGTNKDIYASLIQVTTISEGNNQYSPFPATFATGAPFIPGQIYKVETLPSWSLSKGATVQTPSAGNSTAGSIGVSYKEAGEHTATLTLQNGWGKDSKTFSYVKVSVGSSIDENMISDVTTYPNPFVEEVNVQFEKAGDYTIDVTSITGQLVASRQAKVADGEFVRMTINAEPGHYVVSIKHAGKVLKTIKVIKK